MISSEKKKTARKATTTRKTKTTTGKKTATAAKKKATGRKKTATANAKAPAARGKPRFVSVEERRQMIAEAAYYRAQARGFPGGDTSEDWLAAEAEIDALLVRERSRSR